MIVRLSSFIACAIAFSFSFVFSGCQTAGSVQVTPEAEARFIRADANKDGVLTLEEIHDALVTTLFESRDLNKDGQLTREEWVVGDDPAAIKTFIEYDLNGDGIVTLKEATDRSLVQNGMAADFLSGADANKDGSVDRNEAIAYYARAEGPVR